MYSKRKIKTRKHTHPDFSALYKLVAYLLTYSSVHFYRDEVNGPRATCIKSSAKFEHFVFQNMFADRHTGMHRDTLTSYPYTGGGRSKNKQETNVYKIQRCYFVHRLLPHVNVGLQCATVMDSGESHALLIRPRETRGPRQCSSAGHVISRAV